MEIIISVFFVTLLYTLLLIMLLLITLIFFHILFYHLAFYHLPIFYFIELSKHLSRCVAYFQSEPPACPFFADICHPWLCAFRCPECSSVSHRVEHFSLHCEIFRAMPFCIIFNLLYVSFNILHL